MSSISVQQSHEFLWFIDLIYAFLLNLFGTGIFAFIGFGFPTSRLLPNKYYIIAHPATLKQWYRYLGVEGFRRALMITFWGQEKNRLKYFNGTRKGIQNFVYQTKQSEFGHLGALVLIAILSLILAGWHFYLMAAISTLINLIGNLYPVLLQRHHRMRLGSLANRF
jgi:cytochrome b